VTESDRRYINSAKGRATRRRYARSKKGKAIAMQGTLRWQAKHRDAVRAHNAVHRAKKKDALTPKPCEVCGSTENVQAHHDDYSKPLDVRWLCALDHKHVKT